MPLKSQYALLRFSLDKSLLYSISVYISIQEALDQVKVAKRGRSSQDTGERLKKAVDALIANADRLGVRIVDDKCANRC